MVTLRQAAKAFAGSGIPNAASGAYVRGLVDGMGIKLEPAGNALVMSSKDFARLKRQVEARKSTRALSA